MVEEAKNRTQFRQLVHVRVQEAKVLLDNECYDGAYYLLGYSVECALKACIARRIRRYTFPDRNFVSTVYTHDLITLVGSAGLELERKKAEQTNPAFGDSWGVVSKWKESARYFSGRSEQEASDFYIAVTHRRNGVLTWLKKYW